MATQKAVGVLIKSNNRFHRYGARGIIVCDEWRESFEAFRDWALMNGYSSEMSIDRIDNDGNYCPENCRWSDHKAQARNRTTNKILHGKTLAEWSEILNVNYDLLQQRVDRDGLTLEEAVTKPVRRLKNRPSYIPCPNFKLTDYV